MGQLGDQNTPDFFTVSGTFGQAAGGAWTVPSPGIFVTQINVFAQGNGSLGVCRLYVWSNTASKADKWLLRSTGTFGMDNTYQWRRRSDISASSRVPSDGYLAAGTTIWIGINSSDGTLAYRGDSSGVTDIGNTGDGDFNYAGVAGFGFGYLAAYVDYVPLAAPTISSVSPTAAAPGKAVTVSGTNLLHTSGVTVGGHAATFTAVNDSTLSVTLPSGINGSQTLVVTTPAGTASTSVIVGVGSADSGAAWVSGIIIKADSGSAWVDGTKVYVDNGTAWVQIG